MTTVPFATGSTDTVVYGCKDVYMRVWSYIKRGQNQYCGSPRDKACTDIVPPWVGRLSLPLSSSYRALWTYEDDSPVHHEQAVLQDHTWSGPHEIPDIWLITNKQIVLVQKWQFQNHLRILKSQFRSNLLFVINTVIHPSPSKSINLVFLTNFWSKRI